MACVALATLVWLIDLRGRKRWVAPFAPWLEPRNASLAYAVVFVVLWYWILRVMERRGLVFKV